MGIPLFIPGMTVRHVELSIFIFASYSRRDEVWEEQEDLKHPDAVY